MFKGGNIVPKGWTFTPESTVTKFANARSRQAFSEGGEGRASVIYLPGVAHPDRKEFVNTVFAANNAFGTEPDYSRPIASFNVDWKGGIPDLKHTFYDGFASAVQEVDDAIAKYGYKGGLEHVATANIVNSSTIDSTKSLNILDRVLGLQTRSYLLEMVVTKIAAPQLVFTVDTYSEGSVQGRVPELAVPQIQGHTESRSTQTLFKNVGHLAESEEATLKASHNTMSLRENWTIRDLARTLNSQISTILESATDVSGSDWGAVNATYGRSTNNPSSDINGVVTTIEGNGFNVDFMCMHPRPAMDFNTNDWINGYGTMAPAPQGVSAPVLGQKIYNVNGFPQIVVDQAKTNTICTVGSKDAVWLGVGPTVIANYENVPAGFKGKVIKQWFLPYLAQSGAIRDLTGISA